MTAPPSYPRIPHLPPAPAATREDLILDAAAAARLLAEPVIVEEKLDGANVALWLEGGRVEAATRGGPGARDRAGQLGPLRAWVAARAVSLRPLLADGEVLYGEWLWLRHGIGYDALPDSFIGLDLLLADRRFAAVPQRDEALARAGLHRPPRLYSGVLGARQRLDGLLTRSRFGRGSAEGVIVRMAVACRKPRLAKVIAPGFEPRGDGNWYGTAQRNAVETPAPRGDPAQT